MPQLRILAASAICVVLLSACGKGLSCKQDDSDYAGAVELPALKAPPGLDPPDTRNALKIPQLAEPERKRGKNEPCLDEPPPFSTPKPAPTAQ